MCSIAPKLSRCWSTKKTQKALRCSTNIYFHRHVVVAIREALLCGYRCKFIRRTLPWCNLQWNSPAWTWLESSVRDPTPNQLHSNTRVSHALNWMFHVEEVIFVQSHIKSNAEYSSEVSVVLIHPEISKASSELSTHLFRVVGRSLLGMKFSDNQGDFK